MMNPCEHMDGLDMDLAHAAEEIESLRAELEAAKKERDGLKQVCRNVYEVWAGSEGIPRPETCAEAYLLELVEQMRDEAKDGLK